MAHAVDAVAAVLAAAVPVAAILVLLAALVWPRRAGGCPACGAVAGPSETRCPVCGAAKEGGGP